jgi:anti-sigma factor RsiW
VNCLQFKRLVTLAVDGQLKPADDQDFQEHARLCPPCKNQYAQELNIKTLVRNRIRLVKTPDILRATISMRIDKERSFSSRARRLFSVLPNWLAPVVIMALLGGGFVGFLEGRGGINTLLAPNEDFLSHSIDRHNAFTAGGLIPNIESSDPQSLSKSLTRSSGQPVVVPSLASWTLVGGLDEQTNGFHHPHWFYKQGSASISFAELPFHDVLRGSPMTISMKAREELLKTGRFISKTEDGCTIVLWTTGSWLCAAIGHMPEAELASLIEHVDDGSVRNAGW